MTHKQRVLALLSDGQPHTHHELYRLGCVAHSRVSDLRRDGHEIHQWRDGDNYFYKLVPPRRVPFLCDDCGQRFYNVGWHGEVCGSSNYRLVLVEAGSSNPRGTTPTSRCIEPAVEARDGDPASTSTTTDGNQTGAPGETAFPLSAVSPVQLALVPGRVRGAYDEEAA